MEIPNHMLSDLTAWQKKEAKNLANILDNDWSMQWKNYKLLNSDLSHLWELRGRDWLRVVFERQTKEIIKVFKKKWHETTDIYL